MADFDRLAARLRGSVQRRVSIPIVYQRDGAALPGGPSVGVFTRDWLSIAVDSSGNQIGSTSPMVEVDLSVFPQGVVPAPDDVVSIRAGAELFRVVEVQPDGYGSARLILRLPDPDA